MLIALNLGVLAGACTFAINIYMARFWWPEEEPVPLSSWQSQVPAIVLVATLPSAALVLALVAPLIPLPQTSMFVILVPLSVLALLVERVAAARDRPNRGAAARDRARRWIAQARD
jgi:amino acid transporter